MSHSRASSTFTTSDPPPFETMPSANRSRGRNVHIYNDKDTTAVLGGLILAKGITNANFYTMVEILIIPTDDSSLQGESYFFLQDAGSNKIERDGHPLQPGNYYIVAKGDSFEMNNEPWLVRTTSHSTGTRTQSFCDAVHSRDGRCVISGEEVLTAHTGSWRGFEAAHIFPLAHEDHWIRYNYSRWITILPDRGGTINSVQNGLLLRTDIQQLFDGYDFSINPDDNYKIVFFTFDSKGIAGKHLDQRFLDDPQRPVDQILRWHFRQAVLANMRGAGEPNFEHDFPPGSDIVGDILRGPKAAERMEFELLNRLATQVEIVSSKVT